MIEGINVFRAMMDKHHMTIKKVSDRFNIPYRTVLNWANGYRECPPYIVAMMEKIITYEVMLDI